jgi:hypothetical protein
MVKKSRRNYRKNRKSSQRGGSSCRQRGAGYTVGQSVAPEAPYAQEIIGGPKFTPDCLAATRPGLVGPISGTGGLPGFAGGSRQNMGTEGIAQALGSPVMNGGRYMVDVGQGPINGIGSAGPSAGMAVISRIGCEGGLVNTSPPGALANPTPLRQAGGVGGVDSAYYTAPTAGYGNRPSDFVDSVGGPVLLQQPYDARIMNPACLKTGGRRRPMRKSKKSKRLSRKTRRR